MALWDDLREASTDPAWSAGVRLARDGRVEGESRSDDEWVLRVRVPGRTLPFVVHVWPKDNDWSCDCDLEVNPCPHAAAAVIALNNNGDKDLFEPEGRGRGRLRYRLVREGQGLHLHRSVVHSGEEEPLGPSLVAAAQAGDVHATETDVAIDKLLRYRGGTRLDKRQVPTIFQYLSGRTILLDEEPVQVDGNPVVPVGRVEDKDLGFRVRIVRDPEITEVLGSGVVRCGARLRPIGDGGLSREQRDVLSKGIVFGPQEVGKLTSEVLPQLRAKVPVHILTKRLPEEADSKPRIVFETSKKKGGLQIMPTIVYGDPPVAKVERGELTLLGGAVPVRDISAERRRTRELHDKWQMTPGVPRLFLDDKAVSAAERFTRSKVDLLGSAIESFRRGGEVVPDVSVAGGDLAVDFGGADPKEVLDRWARGQSLVPTPDGWAEIPRGWLEQHGHLVANLLEARRPDGSLPSHALFDVARLAEALDEPPPPQFEALRILAEDFEGLPEAALPANLEADLRAYQVAGVNWLNFLQKAGLGGILADDMGLGKTLQALCVLEGRCLVVAPTSVLFNWKAEAARFRPGFPVHLYHGPQRSLRGYEGTGIVLTSYTLLRNDREILSAEKWDCVVLDEAQAIKNPRSQQAQAAFALDADFRLTLTGTPVENRLEELWSQLHFLNRGLLGGRKDFKERIADPIARGEPGAAAELRSRIKPFVLRRMKEDVAPELPPKTQVVRSCELTPAERAVYDAVRLSAQQQVAEALGQGGVLAALEALLRLRQAACHPALVPGQSASSSSKVEDLLELLDTLVSEGHKALVFSQWTSLLDLLEPHLAAANIEHVRLDGSTRNRAAVVERFQDEEGPPVFLLSLKAGGTGLNLTAADHVVILDPWWNPAVEDQAADRAYRIGQDKPVFVHRIVAQDTVEERILALQERKRALADAALGAADQATAITREELLALVG